VAASRAQRWIIQRCITEAFSLPKFVLIYSVLTGIHDWRHQSSTAPFWFISLSLFLNNLILSINAFWKITNQFRIELSNEGYPYIEIISSAWIIPASSWSACLRCCCHFWTIFTISSSCEQIEQIQMELGIIGLDLKCGSCMVTDYFVVVGFPFRLLSLLLFWRIAEDLNEIQKNKKLQEIHRNPRTIPKSCGES